MNPQQGSVNKDKPKNSKEELVQFSDHSAFNFGLALSWLVALCAVAVTAFFWWLNTDIETSAMQKEKQKNDIIAEITSPANVEVEKKAANFKSAVNALKKAQEEKVSMDTFLRALYTKITNDVVINNIAVSSEGELSINGTTTSYRSTADLMVALKSWERVEKVDLKSVSLQESDDEEKRSYVFAISAKIVKTSPKATAPITDSGVSSSDSEFLGQGGINEEL